MQPSRAHSVAQRVERAVGISPSSETFGAALAVALGPSRHPQLGSPRSRRLDAGRDLRNTAAVIGAPEPLEPAPPAGLGGRAVHGILALGLEKTVALGIALYLPRHLGLADYGRYAFLLSYLGFFQALPDAALEAVLVARLARAAADEAGALAGRGARVRLAVSLVGGIAGLALLALAVHDAELLCGGVVGAAGLVASAATPYRALLRARLRMSAYVGLLAAQAALAVGLLAAVVVAGGGLVAVFAAVSAAAVAGLGLGRLLVGPGARLAADRAVRRALIAEAWPLAASTLAVVGAQQVLQLLLLRLHGAPEVGLLGGARKLTEAIGLLPQALMVSVLPALSLAAATPAGAAGAARAAARGLVIALLPPAAALALWAEPVLTGFFGPSFAAAAPVLRVLAPATLLGATGAVLTNLLVAVGRQRTLLRVTAGAAAGMIALGAALVPTYGAVGAAAAFVAVSLAGQVALLALPATRAEVAPVLAATVSPLALGAGAVAATVALGPSVPVGAALLLGAYPAALCLTGTVTRADLARWRT